MNQQWVAQWYPKLERFLNNTQQGSGEFVLSLPLGGEGRTINSGKTSNLIAVNFPKTADAAPDALFGFAHEAVAKLVDESVTDNTTPAQQRSGATAGYTGNGAVRGGELLIEKTMPELAQAYMRYYLSQTGATPPTGDPRAAFEAAFPLPDRDRDVARQGNRLRTRRHLTRLEPPGRPSAIARHFVAHRA